MSVPLYPMTSHLPSVSSILLGEVDAAVEYPYIAPVGACALPIENQPVFPQGMLLGVRVA